MPLLELPHTAGCLVCGRGNPHGLHLHLHVDPDNGAVTVDFTPLVAHIGFEGIIHGGILATVIDEAMVWAATWAGRRFCVCGEMAVRFRHSAAVGEKLTFTARVQSLRSRLIQTTCEVRHGEETIATATGKYVPLPADRHEAFVATLVDEPATVESSRRLRDSVQ